MAGAIQVTVHPPRRPKVNAKQSEVTMAGADLPTPDFAEHEDNCGIVGDGTASQLVLQSLPEP